MYFKVFLKITPFANKKLCSIFVFDNIKIHHFVELIEIYFDIEILLIYLPPYSCNYNLTKILFSVLK